MQLQQFNQTQLLELMDWFKDESSCMMWGGPDFRYPFTQQSFVEDGRFNSVASWMLMQDEQLAAFGQYYLRDRRCHLAHLAVAPSMRCRGVGKQFISQLAHLGCSELNTNECSLFVLSNNAVAMHAYHRLGFEPRVYARDVKLPTGCLYMVSTALASMAQYFNAEAIS